MSNITEEKTKKSKTLSLNQIKLLIRKSGLMVSSDPKVDEELLSLFLERVAAGLVISLNNVMNVAGKRIVQPEHLALATSALSL